MGFSAHSQARGRAIATGKLAWLKAWIVGDASYERGIHLCARLPVDLVFGEWRHDAVDRAEVAIALLGVCLLRIDVGMKRPEIAPAVDHPGCRTDVKISLVTILHH